MREGMKVSVGTIGHIDHGKATLAAALHKLGAILVDAREAEDMNNDIKLYPSPMSDVEHRPQGLLLGRPRNAGRKAERKARMLEAQRRAFTKEAR